MSEQLIEFFKIKKINIEIINDSKDYLIIELDILVKPAAKVEKIFISQSGALVIQTRAKPVDGEANKDITEKLSVLFGTAKSKIATIRGEKSKNKRFRLLLEFNSKKSETLLIQRINDFLIQEA